MRRFDEMYKKYEETTAVKITQHFFDVGHFYFDKDGRNTLLISFGVVTIFNFLGFLIAGIYYMTAGFFVYFSIFIMFALPFLKKSRKVAVFLKSGGCYILSESFVESSDKLILKEKVSFKNKHVKVVKRNDKVYDIIIACSRFLDFLAAVGRKDFSIVLYGVTNVEEVIFHLEKYGDVKVEKDY